MEYRPTAPARRPRAVYDECGDIILGWFTRVATFLLLLGILAFESISLATAHMSGADVANKVALAAADAYATKHNAAAAYAAAQGEATAHKAELVAKDFRISTDGAVDLAVTQTATTLFLYRTKQTAKWAIVKSSGHANARNG